MDNNIPQNLQERIKLLKEELGLSLRKYNLKIGATIYFPQYRILPVEVELAIQVLQKHGVQYHTAFQDAGEKEEKK